MRAFHGGVTFAVVGLIDLFLGGPATPTAVVLTGTLTFLLGVFSVGIAGAFLSAVGLLPLGLRVLFLGVVGLTSGFGLATSLGAFQAIGGRYTFLGWSVLGVSLGLGLFLTAALFLLHPSAERPRGFASSWGRRPRMVLFFALGLLALGLLFADRRLFPGTYPEAHLALRWTALLSAYLAGSLLLQSGDFSDRRLSLERTALVSGLILALTIPWTIDARKQKALKELLDRPIAGMSVRTIRALSDFDADGYSSLLAGGDCAPFRSAINPGADEIPGNGFDDNCLSGDAPQGGLDRSSLITLPSEPPRQSIVLVTIDTLRADRMSVYGYPRPTTPRLERWSKKACRFDRAYTAGPWTALSVSSLFRGLYPRRLDWGFVWESTRGRLFRPDSSKRLWRGEVKHRVYVTPVNDTHRTLSEWLAARGMRTEAVVDDGLSEFLDPDLGVPGSGFQRYVMGRVRGRGRGDADVSSKAIRRLEALDEAGEPYFLWVHFFGPHDPPNEEDGKPRFGSGRDDLYDHKLRSTDRHVHRFLREIDKLPANRRPAVILTADHGEELGPNHRGHGANLEDANVHVPLLVRGPGFEKGSTDRLVSLVDIFPTILSWADIPLPEGLDGRPLQDEVGAPRMVLSETWRFNKELTLYMDKIAGISKDRKLSWDLMDETRKLQRIDPQGRTEQADLIEREPDTVLLGFIKNYLEQNRRVKVEN